LQNQLVCIYTEQNSRAFPAQNAHQEVTSKNRGIQLSPPFPEEYKTAVDFNFSIKNNQFIHYGVYIETLCSRLEHFRTT